MYIIDPTVTFQSSNYDIVNIGRAVADNQGHDIHYSRSKYTVADIQSWIGGRYTVVDTLLLIQIYSSKYTVACRQKRSNGYTVVDTL